MGTEATATPTNPKTVNPHRMRAELAEYSMRNNITARDIEDKLSGSEMTTLLDLLYKVSV